MVHSGRPMVSYSATYLFCLMIYGVPNLHLKLTSNGNLVSKHRNIGKLERKFESSKIVSGSIQKI